MAAASFYVGAAEPEMVQALRQPHAGLRVALAQIPIEDGNLEHNMRLAEEAAREAARQKADFLNLPEAADWGWLYQQARRDALPIPGKYTDFLAALARRHRMWVSAGCLEKDRDKVYNSAVIIDRAGRIVLKHRKIDTLPWLTKDLYDRGNTEDIRTVDTEFGRLALTICADNFNLKNPQRAADQGAWLLIAPHGFADQASKLERELQSLPRPHPQGGGNDQALGGWDRCGPGHRPRRGLERPAPLGLLRGRPPGRNCGHRGEVQATRPDRLRYSAWEVVESQK